MCNAGCRQGGGTGGAHGPSTCDQQSSDRVGQGRNRRHYCAQAMINLNSSLLEFTQKLVGTTVVL